jgi:hypothetical protein
MIKSISCASKFVGKKSTAETEADEKVYVNKKTEGFEMAAHRM